LWSWKNKTETYAMMCDPRGLLSEHKVPPYEHDQKSSDGFQKGTKIILHGFNQNRTKGFSHDELKDHILWFTKFGSVEPKLRIEKYKDVKLRLKGVDRQDFEVLPFGHIFPEEQNDFKKLKKKDPASPTKHFVKQWQEEAVSVRGYPHVKLDLLFYIEGDKVKSYNPMLRRQGRPPKEGMYRVEDRYGLWLCKDYIPIQQVTDWISEGKRAVATKYHAFVNCQEVRLTANRGDFGNTDADLVNAIEATVAEWHRDTVLNDATYKKYQDELELEDVYRDPEVERKDLEKRKKNAKNKKIAHWTKITKESVRLIEPRQEAGVLALFCTVHARCPGFVPFEIVDYDTRKGYDALVLSPNPTTGAKEYKFVEFKKVLETDFNHSFRHLASLVCWDCSLGDGTEVADINGEKRVLNITRPKKDGKGDHTRYMLTSATETHNIEVYVLKDYLKERRASISVQGRPSSKPVVGVAVLIAKPLC
jgi:hypothetical protein